MKPSELWDPLKVVGQFDNVFVIAISMFTAVVATLAVFATGIYGGYFGAACDESVWYLCTSVEK